MGQDGILRADRPPLWGPQQGWQPRQPVYRAPRISEQRHDLSTSENSAEMRGNSLNPPHSESLIVALYTDRLLVRLRQFRLLGLPHATSEVSERPVGVWSLFGQQLNRFQRLSGGVGRCHRIRIEQALPYPGRRRNGRRISGRYRQFFERDQLILCPLRTTPLSFQMLESLAARYAISPGPKQFRRMQGRQASANQNQDILQHIIGVILSDQTAQVTMDPWLYVAQQGFESFAVVALCSEDPLRFLY